MQIASAESRTASGHAANLWTDQPYIGKHKPLIFLVLSCSIKKCQFCMTNDRPMIPFTDEQSRIALNLEQHYGAWIKAERSLRALPYGLRWAERSGRNT